MAERKEGATSGDGQTSPFGNGKGATMAEGAASGGNNFLTNLNGNGQTSGGRDFTKESRPQSEAKKEVAPNPQEIPAGGTLPYADPSPTSVKVGGPVTTPTADSGGARPFKNLR